MRSGVGDLEPSYEVVEPAPAGGFLVKARRIKRRWYFIVGFIAGTLFLATSTVIAAAFIRLPFFVLAPGSVRNTQTVISVEGTESFENSGEVDYATVSMRRATALGAFFGWLDDGTDVVEEKLILGDTTEAENRQENLRDMTDSKQIATAVALENLGYDVGMTGTGAVVSAVGEGSAASGLLEVGDVVVGADGTQVNLADELVDVIGSHSPGEKISLEVQRGGEGDPEKVEVTLGSRPDDPSKALLGVSTFTRDLEFDFPVNVTIESGSVGGPSAGLAFTLGVMDRLVPQSITGGLKVATTGTIDIRGNVGPVGGVTQKTIAVRRSGADLFLVPSSELEEARRNAGNMRVEPVDTLDDALEVLATVGGGSAVVNPSGS